MNKSTKEVNISESTKLEMAKFFMRTSVPRLIEKRKEVNQNVKRSS